MSEESVTITGTYLPCPDCKAPMIFGHPDIKQRITFSGTPAAARITPHDDKCERTDPPPAKSWGIGLYG